MIRCFAVVLTTFVLAGCAGSPIALSSASDEELRAQPVERLCVAYALMKPVRVRAELDRRALFSAEEWRAIEGGRWWIGMSEAALICSQGKPAAVNQTITAAGVSSQYVFEECRTYCPRRYAYVRNGVVTALQQ